jgi:hypothetical protein
MTTTHTETENASLLVEAVSLLLKRELEIEATITDCFRRRVELRAADVHERWEVIEERLFRIERRLAELAPSVDPRRAGAAELSQLKHNVELLPARTATPATVGRRVERVVAQPEPELASLSPSNASRRGVLGDTVEARLGAVLMVVGTMVLVVVLFMQAGIS